MLCILGATFVLRLIGLDIAGALLSGLMLCFGVIMVRDWMQDLAKYALVYAVLCSLNFFFDILPLITELGGRMSRTVENTDSDGTAEVGMINTPFFDVSKGLMYNAQSMSILLSPIAMGLGICLSLSAHNDIQRLSDPPPGIDAEALSVAFPLQLPQAMAAKAGSEAAAVAAMARGAAQAALQLPARGNRAQHRQAQEHVRQMGASRVSLTSFV
eukprot:CAMPEP_0115243752 /NCGR_PEP_ID=MMETSP0270-20121206/39633_1 /TAXON_ID=71861 /ORGANISM="Scrippsiella trochoidea, Strain CCMP3099" /LENGTH=213 /DNA_ID=CAMNT_0002658865 /DNA_START=204 /DNA_END=842 /DNA_ORIENTATION=+